MMDFFLADSLIADSPVMDAPVSAQKIEVHKKSAAPETSEQQMIEQQTVIVAANSLDIVRGVQGYLSNPYFQIVATATRTEELLRVVAANNPDIVILDFFLKPEEHIDTIARVRSLNAATKIFVLSEYNALSLTKLAFKLGANGYLMSMPTKYELRLALALVEQGYYALDAKLAYMMPQLQPSIAPLRLIS